MTRTRNIFLAGLTLLAVSALTTTAGADTAHWWADNDRKGPPQHGHRPPNLPPNPNDQWQPVGPGAAITLKSGRIVYFAVQNAAAQSTNKSVTITLEAITCADVAALKPAKVFGKGFNSSGAQDEAARRSLKCKPAGGGGGQNAQLVYTIEFAACPEWEWVALKNTGSDKTFNVNITFMAECRSTSRSGSIYSGDGHFGIVGEDPTFQITELMIFPDVTPIDMGFPASMVGPPASGNWFASPVFADPDGNPRPEGGIHFMSDGAGLAPADPYSFEMGMLDPADLDYTVYVYDSLDIRWIEFDWNEQPMVQDVISRHSTSGSLAMSIDPSARGDGRPTADTSEALLPTTEPRLGGIEDIEVVFNRPIVLIDSVRTLQGNTEHVGTVIALDPRRVLIEFVPGTVPDQAMYLLDLDGLVEDLVGDTQYVIGSLTGDADGSGLVDSGDVDLINIHLGEPVDGDNLRLDLDLDGIIGPGDAMIAQDNDGDTILCPGSFPTVPWYEDFDDYDPGSSLHGGCGWKGWDDDPAFDAPVTDAVPSHSGSQSVQIEGPADLVDEYPDVETGAWSYTAWQYIPSDFASGGGGQFDGSWFILLNTYNDGGPYNWSMQVQADSNDGLLKVWDGFGEIGGSVPYETDRWVKIQTIIDLDDDWTRVYYDDDLVTEYSWTGGVLGGGNGLLDIAAVDLFANGSTSLYYDDLKLEPIESPCGGLLVDDLDVDGLTLLEETLLGTDPCNADTDDDGVIDGVDNCPTTYNPDQADSDGDGTGDACDEELDSCPADLDGDGMVGINDFLALLAGWGGPDGDVDGDGITGINDFLDLLAAWGECP